MATTLAPPATAPASQPEGAPAAEVKPPRLTLPAFIYAHFAHHVGTGGLAPLMPYIKEAFQLDYATSGLVLSAQGLSLGFGQLPISALADRFSKRLVVAVGLIGCGLAGIGISLTQSVWQLIPLLIFMGVMAATYHAPAASFLSSAYSTAARGRALGTHVIGGALAFSLAPAIALGTVRLTGSWQIGFLALSVFPLIGGVMMLYLLWRQPHSEHATRRSQADREQVNALAALRSIGPLVGVALVEQLLTASMFAFVPLFLVNVRGVPKDIAGMSIALIAGIGVVSAPLGGALSDRWGRAPVLVLVTACVGPLILALTYASQGWMIVIVLLVFGLAMNARLPVLESLFADAIPAHRRSTVLGLYYFIGQESSGLTTPLVGRLIDVTDPIQAFTILGIIGTAFSALLLFNRQALLRPRPAAG